MEELNIKTNAPTEYGKYVDECLNEAAKHFFSEGIDKYSIADLFYAGIKCKEDWLEKQGKQKSAWNEDDKIRKDLIAFLEDIWHFGKNANFDKWGKSNCSDWIIWLKKQYDQKSNPYSGVSFEYNGHTWGMCARDGGVEISCDKQLIAYVDLSQEKDEFDNLSKPIDNKEIGCNTIDFIKLTPPNHGI